MPKDTMSQLINEFIEHLDAAGRATSTISCYQRDLARLTHILGKLLPKQIAEKDIDHAVAGIAAVKRNGQRRSAATMNRIKSAYRSFFKWAFDSKRIPYNPAEQLRRTKTYSCPTTPITAAEITTLLETIRQSGERHAERDAALFATYAYTGIRRSEALSLTLPDYDCDSSVLYLPRTKNGGRQVRIVPPLLADILTKRVRIALREDAPLGRSLLFPGRVCDRPMSARYVQALFDKWKKLAGIRQTLTLHSFRAGYATSLYETTGDIFLVAHAMGHRDIGTTMQYITANSSVLRRAVEYTFQRPMKRNQMLAH